MVSARTVWTDNERYVAEATSRHAIVMDTANEKTANSPMELVLIALCGCTASDVVGILRKKREPFTSLEVSAEGERADGYPAAAGSARRPRGVPRPSGPLTVRGPTVRSQRARRAHRR